MAIEHSSQPNIHPEPFLRLVATDTEPDTDQEAEDEPSGLLSEKYEDSVTFLESLSRNKSPEVALYFLKQMSLITAQAGTSQVALHSFRDSLEGLYAEIERIPSLAEVQEKALNMLEASGAISRSPEGMIIADLDKIRKLRFNDLRVLKDVYESEFYGAKSSVKALHYIFKGLRVLSREDYENGSREGKSLFYSPANSDEAFDIDSIKKAEFYIGQWEAAGMVSSDQSYPSTEDQTNFAEVSLACALYHPNYGDGYRDDEGRLRVYDQASKRHRTVSGERIFKGIKGIKEEARPRPSEFIEKIMPNLSLKGLLLSEDFQKIPAQMAESPHLIKRRVDLSGSVMMGGIQYYIGKQKTMKASEVYQISSKLGAVCQNGEITHTFALRSLDDPDIQMHSSSRGDVHYGRANKRVTGLSPYDHDLFAQRTENETEQEHRDRVDMLENFETWLKLDKLLGSDGLIYYRQMELDPDTTKIILSLKNEFDESKKAELADAYLRTTRSAREIGNYIRENLGGSGENVKIVKKVVNRMMRRSLKLFLQYAEGTIGSEDFQSAVNDLQSEVAIFSATFKEAKLENGVDIEDFQDFHLTIQHGSKIDRKTLEEMMQILIANRTDRPDIIKQALADLERAAANPDSTFYIMKYDDETIGFFRVDRQGELDAYIGSLNVPPKLQGTGIGDEALKKYFEIALNGRIGHASADPRNPITPLYIGRYNFIVDSIKDYGESGVPYFEMTLDKELNSQLSFFQAEDDLIKSKFTGNNYQIGEDPIILKMPKDQLGGLMEESRQILSTGKYVISAFRKIGDREQDDWNYYAVFELNPRSHHEPA